MTLPIFHPNQPAHPKVTITRVYTFSAAHRLEGHPKCGRMHGHNYDVIVHLTGETDSVTGMVLDYGALDEIVKPIIAAIDHRYIVSRSNLEAECVYAMVADEEGHLYDISPAHFASTAEALALHFWRLIVNLTPPSTKLRIEVRETAKSNAIYPPY